jgi:hypothetical protein
MERVSTIPGNLPIIIAAPHGFDDTNTDVLAEYMAGFLDCFAVINRGWIKSTTVDWRKNQANCNNVVHCHEDVVQDEFLDPLMRYVVQILRKNSHAHLFVIHGVGSHMRSFINDLDVIVGAGRGTQFSSSSCVEGRKDAVVGSMIAAGLGVYEGVDNKYAGRGKNNLNQLYRRWYPDDRVQSMQLEIIYDLRKTKTISQATANIIATCIRRSFR